jgi:hypothetical protein
VFILIFSRTRKLIIRTIPFYCIFFNIHVQNLRGSAETAVQWHRQGLRTPRRRGGGVIANAQNAKICYGFLWTGYLSFDRSEGTLLIIVEGPDFLCTEGPRPLSTPRLQLHSAAGLFDLAHVA